VSRAAQIPTGWEITLDLIRRVAVARGVEDQPDWEQWYREHTGTEPDYSALLAELAQSPQERRAILHSYIEPTEEDRAERPKIPTAAHHAIAQLVRDKYIRVIITTNFDRLIENALREHGIEPTIVASVDTLHGAEPITHSACFLVKLHGDYKDARILNTDVELSAYPTQYNALLDRIFDEHGLIVCGWSGEWDDALRASLLRAPNRRYPLFWAVRGSLGDAAQQLVSHRDARVVAIEDANRFFVALRERVAVLERTRRVNPLSVELLVNTAKRFLERPEDRIRLDELFADEADRAIERLNSPDLSSQGRFDAESFRERIKRYEAATEALACMAGALGRWGGGVELPLVVDTIRTLNSHATRVSNGLTVLLGLRSYPAVLVFTAYALGLVRAERWNTLHRLFYSSVDREDRKPVSAIGLLFLQAWKGHDQQVWQQLEGFERRKTPLSDHLVDVFADWGRRFLPLTPDFELLYERFELLGSLACLEEYAKDSLRQEIDKNSPVWMPIGRGSWHSQNTEKLVAELKSDSTGQALAEAGFGNSDREFVDLFLINFGALARRLGSW
jgi:hypothetical protein